MRFTAKQYHGDRLSSMVAIPWTPVTQQNRDLRAEWHPAMGRFDKLQRTNKYENPRTNKHTNTNTHPVPWAASACWFLQADSWFVSHLLRGICLRFLASRWPFRWWFIKCVQFWDRNKSKEVSLALFLRPPCEQSVLITCQGDDAGPLARRQPQRGSDVISLDASHA